MRHPGARVVPALQLIGSLALALATPQAYGDSPHGWILAGSNPQEYQVGIERAPGPGGQAAGPIKFTASQPHGFGTLMQTFQADAYRGKRLRLSGSVKTSEVMEWAGMWLRIDGRGNMLGFDNMEDRPIKASTVRFWPPRSRS
jgi:hypothetical protein